MSKPSKPTVLELCAGGGGQALGLEQAGFDHAGAAEYEAAFCTTLRTNRPHWNVLQTDIRNLRAADYHGVDLVAAGVPCPPFSVAGKQLGPDDDRDMFPTALEIVAEARPRAVLIENVPGLASARFAEYRLEIFRSLSRLGYMPRSAVLQAVDFGVPQLRPRFVIVALRPEDDPYFSMPAPNSAPLFVGDALEGLMAANGWPGASDWAARAQGIAPTVVGGSKKHGGPEGGGGFGVAVEGAEGGGAIGVEGRGAGGGGEGAVKVFEGAGGVALLAEEEAEEVVGVGVVRVGAEDFAVEVGGGRELPGAVEPEGVFELGGGVGHGEREEGVSRGAGWKFRGGGWRGRGASRRGRVGGGGGGWDTRGCRSGRGANASRGRRGAGGARVGQARRRGARGRCRR